MLALAVSAYIVIAVICLVAMCIDDAPFAPVPAQVAFANVVIAALWPLTLPVGYTLFKQEEKQRNLVFSINAKREEEEKSYAKTLEEVTTLEDATPRVLIPVVKQEKSKYKVRAARKRVAPQEHDLLGTVSV